MYNNFVQNGTVFSATSDSSQGIKTLPVNGVTGRFEDLEECYPKYKDIDKSINQKEKVDQQENFKDESVRYNESDVRDNNNGDSSTNNNVHYYSNSNNINENNIDKSFSNSLAEDYLLPQKESGRCETANAEKTSAPIYISTSVSQSSNSVPFPYPSFSNPSLTDIRGINRDSDVGKRGESGGQESQLHISSNPSQQDKSKAHCSYRTKRLFSTRHFNHNEIFTLFKQNCPFLYLCTSVAFIFPQIMLSSLLADEELLSVVGEDAKNGSQVAGRHFEDLPSYEGCSKGSMDKGWECRNSVASINSSALTCSLPFSSRLYPFCHFGNASDNSANNTNGAEGGTSPDLDSKCSNNNNTDSGGRICAHNSSIDNKNNNNCICENPKKINIASFGEDGKAETMAFFENEEKSFNDLSSCTRNREGNMSNKKSFTYNQDLLTRLREVNNNDDDNCAKISLIFSHFSVLAAVKALSPGLSVASQYLELFGHTRGARGTPIAPVIERVLSPLWATECALLAAAEAFSTLAAAACRLTASGTSVVNLGHGGEGGDASFENSNVYNCPFPSNGLYGTGSAVPRFLAFEQKQTVVTGHDEIGQRNSSGGMRPGTEIYCYALILFFSLSFNVEHLTDEVALEAVSSKRLLSSSIEDLIKNSINISTNNYNTSGILRDENVSLFLLSLLHPTAPLQTPWLFDSEIKLLGPRCLSLLFATTFTSNTFLRNLSCDHLQGAHSIKIIRLLLLLLTVRDTCTVTLVKIAKYSKTIYEAMSASVRAIDGGSSSAGALEKRGGENMPENDATSSRKSQQNIEQNKSVQEKGYYDVAAKHLECLAELATEAAGRLRSLRAQLGEIRIPNCHSADTFTNSVGDCIEAYNGRSKSKNRDESTHPSFFSLPSSSSSFSFCSENSSGLISPAMVELMQGENDIITNMNGFKRSEASDHKEDEFDFLAGEGKGKEKDTEKGKNKDGSCSIITGNSSNTTSTQCIIDNNNNSNVNDIDEMKNNEKEIIGTNEESKSGSAITQLLGENNMSHEQQQPFFDHNTTGIFIENLAESTADSAAETKPILSGLDPSFALHPDGSMRTMPLLAEEGRSSTWDTRCPSNSVLTSSDITNTVSDVNANNKNNSNTVVAIRAAQYLFNVNTAATSSVSQESPRVGEECLNESKHRCRKRYDYGNRRPFFPIPACLAPLVPYTHRSVLLSFFPQEFRRNVAPYLLIRHGWASRNNTQPGLLPTPLKDTLKGFRVGMAGANGDGRIGGGPWGLAPSLASSVTPFSSLSRDALCNSLPSRPTRTVRVGNVSTMTLKLKREVECPVHGKLPVFVSTSDSDIALPTSLTRQTDGNIQNRSKHICGFRSHNSRVKSIRGALVENTACTSPSSCYSLFAAFMHELDDEMERPQLVKLEELFLYLLARIAANSKGVSFGQGSFSPNVDIPASFLSSRGFTESSATGWDFTCIEREEVTLVVKDAVAFCDVLTRALKQLDSRITNGAIAACGRTAPSSHSPLIFQPPHALQLHDLRRSSLSDNPTINLLRATLRVNIVPKGADACCRDWSSGPLMGPPSVTMPFRERIIGSESSVAERLGGGWHAGCGSNCNIRNTAALVDHVLRAEAQVLKLCSNFTNFVGLFNTPPGHMNSMSDSEGEIAAVSVETIATIQGNDLTTWSVHHCGFFDEVAVRLRGKLDLLTAPEPFSLAAARAYSAAGVPCLKQSHVGENGCIKLPLETYSRYLDSYSVTTGVCPATPQAVAALTEQWNVAQKQQPHPQRGMIPMPLCAPIVTNAANYLLLMPVITLVPLEKKQSGFKAPVGYTKTKTLEALQGSAEVGEQNACKGSNGVSASRTGSNMNTSHNNNSTNNSCDYPASDARTDSSPKPVLRWQRWYPQSDLRPAMRSILADWIIDVSTRYSLSHDTFFTAMGLTDAFLGITGNCNTIARDDLQLVGTAATMIASKLHDIYPPTVTEFYEMTAKTCKPHKIIAMEIRILSTLKYHVDIPSVYLFVMTILAETDRSDGTAHVPDATKRKWGGYNASKGSSPYGGGEENHPHHHVVREQKEQGLNRASGERECSDSSAYSCSSDDSECYSDIDEEEKHKDKGKGEGLERSDVEGLGYPDTPADFKAVDAIVATSYNFIKNVNTNYIPFLLRCVDAEDGLAVFDQQPAEGHTPLYNSGRSQHNWGSLGGAGSARASLTSHPLSLIIKQRLRSVSSIIAEMLAKSTNEESRTANTVEGEGGRSQDMQMYRASGTGKKGSRTKCSPKEEGSSVFSFPALADQLSSCCSRKVLRSSAGTYLEYCLALYLCYIVTLSSSYGELHLPSVTAVAIVHLCRIWADEVIYGHAESRPGAIPPSFSATRQDGKERRGGVGGQVSRSKTDTLCAGHPPRCPLTAAYASSNGEAGRWPVSGDTAGEAHDRSGGKGYFSSPSNFVKTDSTCNVTSEERECTTLPAPCIDTQRQRQAEGGPESNLRSNCPISDFEDYFSYPPNTTPVFESSPCPSLFPPSSEAHISPCERTLADDIKHTFAALPRVVYDAACRVMVLLRLEREHTEPQFEVTNSVLAEQRRFEQQLWEEELSEEVARMRYFMHESEEIIAQFGVLDHIITARVDRLGRGDRGGRKDGISITNPRANSNNNDAQNTAICGDETDMKEKVGSLRCSCLKGLLKTPLLPVRLHVMAQSGKTLCYCCDCTPGSSRACVGANTQDMQRGCGEGGRGFACNAGEKYNFRETEGGSSVESEMPPEQSASSPSQPLNDRCVQSLKDLYVSQPLSSSPFSNPSLSSQNDVNSASTGSLCASQIPSMTLRSRARGPPPRDLRHLKERVPFALNAAVQRATKQVEDVTNHFAATKGRVQRLALFSKFISRRWNSVSVLDIPKELLEMGKGIEMPLRYS